MSAIDNQAIRWRVLQSERTLDAEEQATLDAWLEADPRHLGAWVRAAVIDNAIDMASRKHAVYGAHSANATDQPSQRPAHGRRRFIIGYGALAASIAAMAIGITQFDTGDKTTLVTAKGEFRRVALADLSVASINSGSRLEVKLTKDKRSIKLDKGEAWFEVAKNKEVPFIVDAGGVQVRAVGTAFGVRRFADGAEVLVTEGTVEISSDDTPHAIPKARLVAGERTFVPFGAKRIVVTQQAQEVEQKLAWREGKLIFTRHTLSEAVADFNRYSPRRIIIADPGLGDKRIFGQYQIDAPEQFARDISAYLRVPLTVNAEAIIIGNSPAE